MSTMTTVSIGVALSMSFHATIGIVTESLREVGTEAEKLQSEIIDLDDASESSFSRIGKAAQRLKAKIGDLGTKAGASMRSLGDATKRLQKSWGELTQAAGMFQGIGAAITKAAELESILNDVRITGAMSRLEMDQLGETLTHLSVPGETNQSVKDLALAVQTLVNDGMDPATAEAAMRTIGRTVTATGGDMTAFSKTAKALIDDLGITPDGLARSMDQLSRAGKEGEFQLKEMTAYFPKLAEEASEMGLKGSEAVATLGAGLQMAMKDGADPAEAAGNMQKFLAGLNSDEVQKTFKARGLNITKVMADAVAKGENPMEAVLKKMDALLGSDPSKRAARLKALFGNADVAKFVEPMLANLPEYQRVKTEALQAVGDVDADYAIRMSEASQQMKAASQAADNLTIAVGNALAKAWVAVLEPVTPVLNFLAEVASSSPMTTVAVTALGAALLILPPAFSLISTAWGILSKTMMSTGIGAVIALVALGALMIYENWNTVQQFFSEYGGAILSFFVPVAGAALWLMDNWEPVADFFVNLWNGITETISSAVGGILDLWQTVAAPIGKLASYFGWKLGGDDSDTADAIKAKVAADEARMAADKARKEAQAQQQAATQPTPAQPTRPRQLTPMPTMPAVGSAMDGATPSGASARLPGVSSPPGAGLRAAMSGAGAQAATQISKIEILVRFLNPPSGTSIETRGKSDRVLINASVGPAMAGIN